MDISCVFCGWYLDWRVSLGIVRGVVSHEFSMKFPFYSTAKLLVILAHFSHRKLTNTTIMLIFFSWFFHVKCGKTSLSILVTLQNNLDHQKIGQLVYDIWNYTSLNFHQETGAAVSCNILEKEEKRIWWHQRQRWQKRALYFFIEWNIRFIFDILWSNNDQWSIVILY